MNDSTTGRRAPSGPFVGLQSYSEAESLFFGGRDAEVEIVAANLSAARLTLMYGPSGVGKTSLLCAGVVPLLREQADRNQAAYGVPGNAVVFCRSWLADPVNAIVQSTREAVTLALNGRPPDLPDNGDMLQVLKAAATAVGGDIFVICDQVEEYFRSSIDADATFDAQLALAIQSPELPVSFLLSIREDSLATLDRLKGRIPTVFDNTLRIAPLTREAARSAIERSIDGYNRIAPPGSARIGVEKTFLDAVLDQVALAGPIALAGPWDQNRQAMATSQTWIDPPYLQLVMSRAWEAVSAEGRSVLTLDAFLQLGSPRDIIENEVLGALDRLDPQARASAASMFQYLVTPSGALVAQTASDLAVLAGITEVDATPVLRTLSGRLRILRTIPPTPGQPDVVRYELFHERLAPGVRKWASRQQVEHRRGDLARMAVTIEEQRRTLRWMRLLVLVLTAMFLVAATLAIVARR